jgi:hypothetical protein
MLNVQSALPDLQLCPYLRNLLCVFKIGYHVYEIEKDVRAARTMDRTEFEPWVR